MRFTSTFPFAGGSGIVVPSSEIKSHEAKEEFKTTSKIFFLFFSKYIEQKTHDDYCII